MKISIAIEIDKQYTARASVEISDETPGDALRKIVSAVSEQLLNEARNNKVEDEHMAR
jgi:hypothetical protein